jgi:toluene monooxygenase system ferredoxin subunit
MSTVDTRQFVEVCAADDLWIGDMECFEVGLREILLLNVEGEIQAFDGRCPHQSAPLIEGRFDGKVLTCRAHEWSFDACTGRSVNPKGECLRRYPLRIVDGKVFVATEPQTD